MTRPSSPTSPALRTLGQIAAALTACRLNRSYEGLKHISKGCVFIYCQVGEKPYWKDPNNDFRKKPESDGSAYTT